MIGLDDPDQCFAVGDMVRIRSYFEDECGILGYAESSDFGMVISAIRRRDMPPASYEVLYHGQLQVYPRSELSPMVSL